MSGEATHSHSGRDMTEERRYQEEEVKAIFEAAATEPGSRERPPYSGAGLTLAELQAIGDEVGLAPERIAEAASALDRSPTVMPRRTYLGMPVSVGLAVDLPRAPSDREWELLVSELRQTFRARGRVESHGSLREWTNGNLHAYVEPTETGHRLRMGTLKGNAMSFGTMGIAGILMGLFVLVAILLTGKEARGLFAPLFLGGMGAAALASGLLGLPRWAREREKQMEHVASRARALIRTDAGADRRQIAPTEGGFESL